MSEPEPQPVPELHGHVQIWAGPEKRSYTVKVVAGGIDAVAMAAAVELALELEHRLEAET